MHKKLIVILIGLIVVFGGGLAEAGEKQEKKVSDKPAVSSEKCWKRTWIPSEALMGRSTMPVCKAFEEVLNTICESPEKLRCNWSLPAEEKRFKKLVWKQINPEEHRELIEDMVLGREHGKERWNTKDPKLKKTFEENKIRIKTVSVDIDGDGVIDLLVHQNWRTECLARGGFCVIDPETKRLDWRFEHVLSDINASEGAEIMLYNDEAYMFGWDDTWKVLMIYRGFYVNAVNARGNNNICQFKYIRGDN